MRSLKLHLAQFQAQHHVRILSVLKFEVVIKPVRDRAEGRRRFILISPTQAERFYFGFASVERGPHCKRGCGGAAASGEGKEVPMCLRPDPSDLSLRFWILRDEAVVAILDHHQRGFARRESVIPTLRYEFDAL